MKWVVFVQRPFYPQVEGEYETLAEAEKAADKVVREENEADGTYKSKVYVAKIECVKDMRTWY